MSSPAKSSHAAIKDPASLSEDLRVLQLRPSTAKSVSCCCCSVAQSCPTLWDPMDCSMPGFPVLHCLRSLLKLKSIESIMPCNHLILRCPFSSCPQSLPASGSFPAHQLFTSSGQSIRTSASVSVLPTNILSPSLYTEKIREQQTNYFSRRKW